MDHAPRRRHAEDIRRDSRCVPAAAPRMTNQAAAAAANGHPASDRHPRYLLPSLQLIPLARD